MVQRRLIASLLAVASSKSCFLRLEEPLKERGDWGYLGDTGRFFFWVKERVIKGTGQVKAVEFFVWILKL